MNRLASIALTLVVSTLLTSCEVLWRANYEWQGRERQPRPVATASATQPILIPILHGGKERYQVAREWSFNRFGHVQRVPMGLVVDGASVPRPAWFFMPPDGLHRRAALAHDWTYLHHGVLSHELVLNRSQADDMFYDFMIESGIHKWRAGTAYRCVRLGGWAAWNSKDDLVVLPVEQDRLMARKKFTMFAHLYAR